MTTSISIRNVFSTNGNYSVSVKEFMSNLEKILQFLSVSSISVGISGFFATFVAYILLGISPNLQICFVVFLMSFSLYSLNKLTDLKEDSINMPERLNFLRGRRNLIKAYSIVAYFLGAFLAFLYSPPSVAILAFPLIANVFYGSKLLPFLPRIKDIPIMKNIVVSAAWAITTTLLPAAHTMDKVWTIAAVICFMLIKGFINTVLYDIRDIIGDKENGIKTLPVLIGSEKTVLVLLTINAMLLPLLMLLESYARFLAAALLLYGFIYMIYFGERKNPLAMDIFVDGEWMLAGLLTLIIKGAGLLA